MQKDSTGKYPRYYFKNFNEWFIEKYNDVKTIVHIGGGFELYDDINENRTISFIYPAKLKEQIDSMKGKHYDFISVFSATLAEQGNPKAYEIFNDLLKCSDTILLLCSNRGPMGMENFETSLCSKLWKEGHGAVSISERFVHDLELHKAYLVTHKGNEEYKNRIKENKRK